MSYFSGSAFDFATSLLFSQPSKFWPGIPDVWCFILSSSLFLSCGSHLLWSCSFPGNWFFSDQKPANLLNDYSAPKFDLNLQGTSGLYQNWVLLLIYLFRGGNVPPLQKTFLRQVTRWLTKTGCELLVQTQKGCLKNIARFCFYQPTVMNKYRPI